MDVQYRIRDLRELLNLIDEATKNIKNYGEEFIPDLIADLKATTDTLVREMEQLGQSKELGYAENILKGLYPENI